jgi:hypothetical protein
MGETKVRYRVIRVADKTDDQKTASDILNALVSSLTQEELQEFLLSQVKRIIYGNNTGTWSGDFKGAGILSLEELTQIAVTGSFELPAICQPTDQVGDLVHISGDSLGGVIQVTKVDITDYSKMPGVGAIIGKSSPTQCKILRYGILSVTGLVPGKIYFVDFDGTPTPIRPVAVGNQKVLIQVIGVAIDSSKLMLNPSFNLTRVIL